MAHAERLVALLDGEIDQFALDVGIVACGFFGIGNQHVDDDVFARRCGLGLAGHELALAGGELWLLPARRRRHRLHASGHRPEATGVALLDQRVIAQIGVVVAHARRHRRVFLGHPILAHLDDGVHLPAHVPDRVDPTLVLHVAGASVPSTVPRQTHMLGLMSTLTRVIVNTLSALSLTMILAASCAAAGLLASLVSAYSTVGARGAIIIPTPMLAREDLARSTIDCCLSSIFMSLGAEWNTWFQSLPS